MGNYRFRLSDMIPNAWFYKLKDMNKPFKNTTSSQNPNKKKSSPPSTTTTQLPHFSNPRHSYYFTTDPFKAEKLYNSPINPKTSDTHFPEPPRKSSKRSRRPSTKTKKTLPPKVVTSTIWPNPVDSTSEHSDHHSPFDSSPDFNFYDFHLREPGSHGGPISGTDPFDSLTSWSSSCSCRISSSTADIIIDMDGKESFTRKFDRFQLELPPILTKPAKFSDMVSEINKKEKFSSSTKLEQRKTTTTTNTNTNNGSLSVKVVKEQKNTNSSIRKTSVSSPGVKIRSNSPKIASKKIQAYSRKSISSNTTTSSKTPKKNNKNITGSFAIVKSSFDPQRDFRESMVEMIVENNIRASKDLEELLACYLSLNSNEYHDLIIKVFEQIWFDLTNFRL